MTRKLSEFPLYPLLLAAYFPLYLMSADLGMTNLADVVRPLVVCVALALVATAVLGRVLRDVHRAALWVAMAFIVIFDFRLLQQMIDGVFSFWIKELPGIYALAGMVAVAVLIGWRARPGRNVTRIANVVAAVMVAFPAITLAQRALVVNTAVAGGQAAEQGDAAFEAVQAGGERPDIVHIVLDGYSRADVLARYYGFDNSGFLDGLKAMGFAVADGATSPYSQTLQTMTSIFTASDLDGVGGDRTGAGTARRLAGASSAQSGDGDAVAAGLSDGGAGYPLRSRPDGPARPDAGQAPAQQFRGHGASADGLLPDRAEGGASGGERAAGDIHEAL